MTEPVNRNSSRSCSDKHDDADTLYRVCACHFVFAVQYLSLKVRRLPEAATKKNRGEQSERKIPAARAALLTTTAENRERNSPVIVVIV